MGNGGVIGPRNASAFAAASGVWDINEAQVANGANLWPNIPTYPSVKSQLSYTGADQTYVVPAGVSHIRVKCWGAGGGSDNWYDDVGGGGSGGYAYSLIPVTAGESLTIVVGQAGTYGGSSMYGGGGGFGVAGTNGGGGGGVAASSGHGSGGGASGIKRGSTWLVRAGGGGGMSNNGPSVRYAGLGGGTGTGQAGTYTSPSYGGASIGDTVINGATGSNYRVYPANSGDADYAAGVGMGSYSNSGSSNTTGGNGRVVIY